MLQGRRAFLLSRPGATSAVTSSRFKYARFSSTFTWRKRGTAWNLCEQVYVSVRSRYDGINQVDENVFKLQLDAEFSRKILTLTLVECNVRMQRPTYTAFLNVRRARFT